MNNSIKSNMDLACAKIAHEIKNPLSVVASTLQLIEIQLPEVKKNKHWHKLYREIEFISTLLNDFNKLSNQQDVQFGFFDLGELVSEVVDRFEPYAISKKVVTSLSLPEDIYNIEGDEVKLMEAFTNLLKNAVEAIEDEGFVNVSLSGNGEVVSVTIEDNGCGIEPEHLSTIFRPFVSYKEDGSGLGLPIVVSIIECHKGTIEIQSTKNVGTKFTITLPLLPN